MKACIPEQHQASPLLFAYFFSLCVALFPLYAFAQSTAINFDQTGEIQVSIEDQTLSGPHNVRFDLMVRSGADTEVLRLLFTKPMVAKDLPSGTIARVKGNVSTSLQGDRVVIVDEFEPLFMQSIRGESITGTRRALPVRVNFSDGSPTASISDLAGFMWDGTRNLNNWYQAASNGLVSFPRETNGSGSARVEEVTIAFPKSGCNPSGWANAVDTILTSRGIIVADYDHIIYFLPQTGCGWAGLGNLGCSSTCRAWTNNYGTPNSTTADIVFHEIGHNLTLEHARTDPDNTGTATCEYCDTSSGMGYGGIGYRGFPSQAQEQLGWLPSERVLTTSTSQTLTLIPTEVNALSGAPTPGSLQLVKVPYPNDATRYYLISMRSRIGSYANNLPNSFNNKVSIHWGHPTDTGTNLITALSIGETYTSGAISFSYLSSDGSSAVVQFTNGSPPTATPVPSATPTVSASPTLAISPIATHTPRPPGGPREPPNDTPPTATPNPNTGIAAVTIRGYSGTATLRFVSSLKSFTAVVRNQKATKTLPNGTYRLFLVRNSHRISRRKPTLLGSISIEAGTTTHLLFSRFA